MIKDCVRKWLVEQMGVGDEEMLQSLYDEYCATVRAQLLQARADMAATDFPALDRTAHALKGAALATGDEVMLEAVLLLRDAAKASDVAAAAAAADRCDTLAAAL